MFTLRARILNDSYALLVIKGVQDELLFAGWMRKAVSIYTYFRIKTWLLRPHWDL